MPQHSIAYQAARARAAFFPRPNRGRIVVSGADRRSYLQGLLTNDIESLTAGRGCYAAYLTAQGRMIADLWVYELGDAVLLTMLDEVKATVLARLDQFIFSEDVQLGDVSGTFAQIAIAGPAASSAVAAATGSLTVAALDALPLHGNIRGERNGAPIIVTRIDDLGEPGFDVYVERDQAPVLVDALRDAGVNELADADADTLRVEGGVPAFHRDMDEETIPLEAGIEARAISLTKGCYVGQEVIIRVLHRGHGRVARRLVGLRVASERTPATGAIIRAADREIGEVTSAVFSPALQQPIALGYVQRDFVEAGTSVTIDGVPAVVTALPFVAHEMADG
jgi:folate-binding protein YgfZ